ncbi:MAG: zinc ABC transporter substrate-binding protein [Acidobacteria bacterium]|nr:zinc ABC transporter substrate-binding protein [Acidobacteriota bacterium]
MKNIKTSFLYIVFILVVFSFFLLAAEREGKPVLFCSTTQINDFVKNVVGDDCIVYAVLPPGADPHTYQPTPGDAQRAASVDLCFENGLHLEGKNWMATLAKDAGKPIVTCTDGIEPLIIEKSGQTVPDPHAWFDPRNAAVYVRNITEAVCKLDPINKEKYEARARLYLQQLRNLHAWIKKEVSRIPPHRRILITSHDAFNYFGRTYNIDAQAPVGWSTGSEIGAGMTPKRRIEIIESTKKMGVRAFFVETSVNPKLIREIARETGIKIGGELYSDSMGEHGTAGDTYIGMMRENVLKIVKALE